MERPRDDRTTHGYPEIWRVELVQQLVRGRSAYAKRLDFIGSAGGGDAWQQYQKTPQQQVLVHDSLRRFSGQAGTKFWVLYKHDARRFEIIGPAESEDVPAIVRFELAQTLARGASASAYPVAWDDNTASYVLGAELIVVNDFSKSVPTSLGPGTRGLAIELPDRPGVYEIIEIERPVTETGQVLVRIELTTNLPWGGTAQAKQVVWDDVNYVVAGDPFLVRDYTGHRWEGFVGYRGWALEPADRTGQWEIVQLDNIAEELDVTLAEGVTDGQASCAVVDYFRGRDPGTTVTVRDTHSAFTNYKSGAKAKATRNDEDGRYEFVFIQHPAKWAWGKVKSSFTKSNQFATVEIVKTWDGVAHAEGTEVAAENPPNYKGTGDPYIFEATISGTQYHTCRVSYDVATNAWKLDWVVC
jgi:hypothetical protein